jgi:hypothetical protein
MAGLESLLDAVLQFLFHRTQTDDLTPAESERLKEYLVSKRQEQSASHSERIITPVNQTTFRGTIVTRQQVIDALKAFADAYPDPNAYEKWLETGTYRYAIDYENRLYPPKYILHRITDYPLHEFSGGEQTNRVFEQLGFIIIEK